MGNKRGSKIINKIFLWTFIANLIVGGFFYLAWCFNDMQREIRSLESERNELIGRLEEIAAYKEKNGSFQADLNRTLEELLRTLKEEE